MWCNVDKTQTIGDSQPMAFIQRKIDQRNLVRELANNKVDALELIREALRVTGIERGVEITTMADVPSAGSGLGSSSTVTVGVRTGVIANAPNALA